jgi:hypothetical protein
MPNINTILRDHVTLQLECIDRLYLNGYQPRLQTDLAIQRFFVDDRGNKLASPVLMREMTKRFVRAMEAYVARHHIPVVAFERGRRKEDIARARFARFRSDEGVVFLGVAQERVMSFRASRERTPGWQRPLFRFYRAPAYVKQYYVYLLDRDFGPAFIKFSTYFPYDVKIWINGHEWAKRQLHRAGIRFVSLDNGFLHVSDAARAQAICDGLSADRIDAFFRRWLARLPHPFTRGDRAAGHRYRLSIWQLEMSRTEVFDRPLAGRQFFEEVIRDNLDLGRPDRVQVIFDRRITRLTPGSFRTRVLTAGVEPTLRIEYKRTTIKQYFKEGRALRTETTINNTRDFGVGKDLHNLEHLRRIGRNANRRLLSLERLSHNCAVTTTTFERVILPGETDGQRIPGLRFGDPRVMALLSALCLYFHLPTGFSNRTFRHRVGAFLGRDDAGYRRNHMTYDLRRLRLKGLIQRLPGTHRYVVTPAGRRIALFFTKSYARVIRRGMTRLDVAAPADPLADAWNRFDRQIDDLIADARLAD